MWTLQDAKNKFSAVVEAALAGAPQEVSRRGRPAVVVLAAAEYQRLLAGNAGPRGSFAAHLLAFPGDDLGDDLPRARVTPRDVTF
jgi:antitoxin Phd